MQPNHMAWEGSNVGSIPATKGGSVRRFAMRYLRLSRLYLHMKATIHQVPHMINTCIIVRLARLVSRAASLRGCAEISLSPDGHLKLTA